MRILYIVLLLITCCVPKEKDPYDQAYRDIVGRMSEQLNRLGSWDYSPDGKDSLWNKTDATNNLNLLDSVFAELEPIEREWDSLTFIARKYDSILLPSELMLKRREDVLERKIFLMEYRPTLTEAVKAGLYDKNGKKLVDVLEQMKSLNTE